ncbi:hypothetical protein [Spiroplasma phoeniceum]|uniref:hypothetical protein n=1 Tax=Spiroplasma phoeniceum TaxID=47835 RepID=UPI0033651B7F
MRKILSLYGLISIIGPSISTSIANTSHQNQDKNIMIISSNEEQKQATKQFGIKIEYKNINQYSKPNDYYQKIKKIKTINLKIQQSNCALKEVL